MVTYQITPPSGSWNAAPNGTYTISLVSNPPSDLAGNSLPTGSLDSFTVNVSSQTLQVSYTKSGLVYNRATKLFGGTVTLTNTGTVSITGQLQVTFTGLPAGVTLSNATGSDSNGDPYLLVNVGTLAAGKTFTFSVYFSDPNNVLISYLLQITQASNSQATHK